MDTIFAFFEVHVCFVVVVVVSCLWVCLVGLVWFQGSYGLALKFTGYHFLELYENASSGGCVQTAGSNTSEISYKSSPCENS